MAGHCGPFGGLGSEKRMEAELCVGVCQVIRIRVVFNSSPVDVEFITWKHEEVRQTLHPATVNHCRTSLVGQALEMLGLL